MPTISGQPAVASHKLAIKGIQSKQNSFKYEKFWTDLEWESFGDCSKSDSFTNSITTNLRIFTQKWIDRQIQFWEKFVDS